MANEQEVSAILKAAHTEKILEECRYSESFREHVNTANEILCYLSEKDESGAEIAEIADKCGMSFNTAAIYLRQLEKLRYCTWSKEGNNKKKYFSAGISSL